MMVVFHPSSRSRVTPLDTTVPPKPLPFTLTNPETEVYGYPFNESVVINNTLPVSGSMVFSVGAQTLCTTPVSFSTAGATITCNAAESGLAVGTYTVNFTFTSTNSFYSSVTGTTTLQVTRAPLTVTPNNFSRPYGTANPTLTGTLTGAVNGDVFNVSYSTTATITSPVGTYPITATLTPVGTANLNNYTLTNNTGTLTITQSGSGGSGGLVVNVNCTTRPYGQLNPTFTGTVTGLLNGDTVTVTYSTTATQFSPVGNYTITAVVSGAAAANYVVTVNTCTLGITPAGTGGTTGLTVNVNSTSRPYGTPNPTFTGTVTGLLNGDTVTVTYSTTATITSPVGTYPITATVSGAAAANYVITVHPGTLTITAAGAPLIVTVNNASRPYGAANPAFTSSISGALNGDTFTINYSTVATPASLPGNYAINATVSGAAASNYNITVVPGTLTVTPTAPLVVTVNNASRPYGQLNPTFTSTISGALNGDTFTVTYSTTAAQFSPVGNYPITATVSGAAAANYAITVVPGTLTVTPAAAPLIVTVFNASRPYGTPNPAFTSTISGALNGDTFTVTYSTTASITSPVGAYPINITLSGPAAANYTIVVNPGTLIVTTAITPLVVTVSNATRHYGTANPTFTGTITGLLNGDSVLVAFSTPATITSPVGTYAINATVTGASAANYNITVVPGILTVTTATAPLVVTVNNATRPYGQANPAFTGSVSGAINGDTFTVTYSTPATVTSPVGTYPINATVTGAAAANYNITVVPGTLTITPAGTGGTAGLVITVNNASRPYNTANPTFTGTLSGLLNGDTVTVTYSTPATITSPVGNYPITATVSGTAAANYTITVNPGTLSITPTNTALVVTVNNATRPYGTANPTFTSTISGALNGDTFTVTYSTAATIASPVGTYTINATVSGANIANYIVTVVPGTLTITTAAAPLVVTVNNANRPFNTANPTFTSAIAGALNGDTFTVTYSTTATIASPVGAYPINATVTGANLANYPTVTVVPGTLTITPIATATTVITSASPVFEGTSVTFTATVTYAGGLVTATTVNFYNGTILLGSGTLNSSGIATYTTSTLPVGSLTITATYQATANFASSSGTVLQVINPGGFTVAAVPPQSVHPRLRIHHVCHLS